MPARFVGSGLFGSNSAQLFSGYGVPCSPLRNFPEAFRTEATGCIETRGVGDIPFDLLPIASIITNLLAPGTDGNQTFEGGYRGRGFLEILDQFLPVNFQIIPCLQGGLQVVQILSQDHFRSFGVINPRLES